MADFKNRSKGRTRESYRAELLRCVCTFYGYNEYMADKILELFSYDEVCYFSHFFIITL